MANLDEQLWDACLEENWVQAAFLLEAGAGTEWRSERSGMTAIIWAAWRGSLETVTLLFNRGANIHARCSAGWNPLMNASGNDRANIVSYLADKGTDIHVRNNDGQDALLIAALWGHIDTALELIARRADARVEDDENHTALTHFGLQALPSLSDEEKQQGRDSGPSWHVCTLQQFPVQPLPSHIFTHISQ